MRFSILLLISVLIVFASSQSTSDTLYSSSTESVTTSKYANSSPTSSSASSYGPIGSSESTETDGTEGTSGTTNKDLNSPTSTDSLNLDDVEKLVTYTTKQKTIFIACCGGTFVLLIALAILSGMSDTIARSRQKNSRTHA